ncbi:atrial natriuretic peptide receptor 2-like [Gigantopelta aegis]|uniref:atrial natriuretic peptide receptor 2-like n=1 Tax=Gigantopelta aegis TaxID=1735272 RepID=UPI001B887FA8|nr:atrial natriuretic peptide receptor 2-like [Gigantopelta aegis]
MLVWTAVLLLVYRVASEELQIVWMVPNNHPLYNISTSIGPLAMALKRIEEEQMLPGYILKLTFGISLSDCFSITWLDSACSSQMSIGRLTEYLLLHDHIDVIIGPPCVNALQPVANLAGFYDIPVFTWMSREHTVDDKSIYDTLVRTRPPITSLGKTNPLYMFYSISEKFNWSRAAILYTDEVPNTKTLALAMITKFTEDKEFNLVNQYVVSLRATDNDLREIFESIKKNARIIFLMIPRPELRRYMLAFHDHGMTNGEYQYLFTEMDLAEFNIIYNETLWRGQDGRDDDARTAFGSLLYCNQSLSGEVFMNGVGDRFPSFVVWDLARDGTFQMVLSLNYTPGQPGANVRYNKVEFLLLLTVVQYRDIIWGDGRISSEYIPSDIPDCGFYNEFCPPDNGSIILLATTISIALALIITAAVVIGRWWRREQEIYQMAWNVPLSELDFNFRKTRRRSLMSMGTESVVSDSVSTYAGSSTLGSYGLVIAGASLFSLKHPNLATLAGMCLEDDKIDVLWEYCMKGSLQGLGYIHGGPIKYHGSLKSTNCVIDNHWACKLTDFGMMSLKKDELLETEFDENEKYTRLFWMAPELVRLILLQMPYIMTQQADIYALGVILKELVCLNRPYAEKENLTPKGWFSLHRSCSTWLTPWAT